VPKVRIGHRNLCPRVYQSHSLGGKDGPQVFENIGYPGRLKCLDRGKARGPKAWARSQNERRKRALLDLGKVWLGASLNQILTGKKQPVNGNGGPT
jgi:hypothetical protein